MVRFWCKYERTFLTMFIINVSITLAGYWTAIYIISFNIIILQYCVIIFNIIYLLIRSRKHKENKNLWVVLFILGSLVFYESPIPFPKSRHPPTSVFPLLYRLVP